MRLAVMRSRGQAEASLLERAGPKTEIVALARLACALGDRESVLAAIAAAQPDAVINPAADKAERGEREEALADPVAEASARAGAPLRRLWTDCVFGGTLDRGDETCATYW